MSQRPFVNLGRTPAEKKLIEKRAAFDQASRDLDSIIQNLFRFKEQLKYLSNL